MNETPLPLIVFATSTFGRSPTERKSAKTWRERLVIVPVARRDVPAERAQLRLEVAEREDLLGRLIRLQLVAVDEHPEIAGGVTRRGLQAFEVLALLELAVARDHDDASAAAEEGLRPGHAAALRDAHPERARVRLDAGGPDIRMAVEAAEAAQA